MRSLFGVGPAAAVLPLTVLVLALGGCGRKGPLELPPGAPPETPQVQQSQERITPVTENPGLVQLPNQVVQKTTSDKMKDAVKNPQKPINTPGDSGKPFVLDPLL